MERDSHAIITGTGRAGTTFLIQFLDACGLDTGMTDSGWREATWHERARAGLEQHLRADDGLPYVVKDPWLFAYCDELEMNRLRIDALIVPMRDLMLAAESRVHQERMALTEGAFVRDFPAAQIAATTPGGVLYSLDAVDQARILAVGFHKLLHWAAAHQLPLFLLSFPSLVEDRDYLLETLWPWLGEHCTIEAARAAFAHTSRPEAVRVQRTSGPGQGRGRAPRPEAPHGLVLGPEEPDRSSLERKALIERLGEVEDLETHQRELVAAAENALDEARRQIFEQEQVLAAVRSDLDRAVYKLATVQNSRSWRVTRPLRAFWQAVSPGRPRTAASSRL